MTGLITPGPKIRNAPFMVHPEVWRDYITTHVVQAVQAGYPQAVLMHCSIQPGANPQAFDATPPNLHHALMTVVCIYRLHPQDLPALYLPIHVGCLALAEMGADPELPATIKLQVQNTVEKWQASIAAMPADVVASNRREMN